MIEPNVYTYIIMYNNDNGDHDDGLGALILRLFIRFFFGLRTIIFWHRSRAHTHGAAVVQVYNAHVDRAHVYNNYFQNINTILQLCN